MKITKKYLQQVIKEELQRVYEMDMVEFDDGPEADQEAAEFAKNQRALAAQRGRQLAADQAARVAVVRLAVLPTMQQHQKKMIGLLEDLKKTLAAALASKGQV